MCLRVGVVAAQDLCAAHNIPIVPVHHMEAHGLVARLAGGTDLVRFPFLALLVSGGHNQLILTRGVGDHVILGSTLDDALGEAYDKTARLLGLDVGGGGGPALELLAREGDPKAYAFPVPLRKRKNCDFSYAGLKTAARMAVERDLGVPEGDAAFTTVCAPGARAVTPEVRPAPASDEKNSGRGKKQTKDPRRHRRVVSSRRGETPGGTDETRGRVGERRAGVGGRREDAELRGGGWRGGGERVGARVAGEGRGGGGCRW